MTEIKKLEIGGLHFDYDDNGRVIHIKHTTPLGIAYDVYQEYDENGRVRIVKSQTNNEVTTYEFDDDNRVIHECGEKCGCTLYDISYTYLENCIITETCNDIAKRIQKTDSYKRIILDETTNLDTGTINRHEYAYFADHYVEIYCIIVHGKIISRTTTTYPTRSMKGNS